MSRNGFIPSIYVRASRHVLIARTVQSKRSGTIIEVSDVMKGPGTTSTLFTAGETANDRSE
jgi:hypothetical protein